ncbi:unnamed protein product [Clonostachys solani]|uniref:Uncharacterized protein n=1 Tax=Clonostachys solani TaxID=160281 RepID=A0A9N9W5H0_9HYPO|nr:unnamed protein product [Clonostachys solani]
MGTPARLFALSFLVIHASAEVPDPTITEAPSTFELVARQNQQSSNFLGYTVDSTGGYDRITCGSGSTFAISSSLAGCARTSAPGLPTSCRSSSTLIYATGSALCPSNLPVCGFHFIYTDLDDQAPFTRVGCAKVPNPIRYYRTTTGSRSSTRITTTRSSTSRTTSRTTARISSTSGIESTTFETSTISSTSSENPTSSETDSVADDVNEPLPEQPASLAWIAGPIVGGIAGLVIIGLLVWIIKLLRRRSAARQDAAITPAGPQQSPQVEKFVAASPNPTVSQPSPAPPYTSPRSSQWTNSAELPAFRVSSPPTELAGSGQWGSELPGDAIRRG